ncbi:Piso0_002126 [Millerozyma farinosa CBS 7064]|uniref:Piso0_002126 protein n=1 Tax=Pichia sorbitophila (strain ATCC MYA-4447 / BCRC 22081 / CBS 7064 / NBRC 10061 / NRRL Y-12695) TaxID=559304 RepID=G8YE70_PICSO|nr:Piso0_002126 [Millerozyma farinosa CBS 7064]
MLVETALQMTIGCRKFLDSFLDNIFANLFYSACCLLLLWGFLDVVGIGAPSTIKNILVIPGYPLVGNIFQVLNNPALVYMRWASYYKTSIFQVRLGIKRIVVVNSYEDVKNLWIKHSCSNNSRPVSYTFHDVVSATQGFTIGSTPVGDTYKKKKKTVSSGLNHRRVIELENVIDEESRYTIRKIMQNDRDLLVKPSCNNCRYYRTLLSDVDMLPFAQLYALRSSIYITYGLHLNVYEADADLAKEIIEVENNIMKFRAPIANLQDYLPFLRYIPWRKNVQAQHYRQRRDKYMDRFLELLKARMNSGDSEAISSLIGKTLALNDPKSQLTPAEVKSVCLTMVSAGLDNTPLNFNHLMGQLSYPSSGYYYQRRVFDELMQLYSNSVCLAWEKVVSETSCDFAVALIQETLRYFTVLPLGLPRATSKDIVYNNAVIPKGTTLFMNAFAANHDPKKFANPMCFKPERWLNPETKKLLPKESLIHFSFGAGSRMCSGNHLAFKEIYALLCRAILVFQIKRPTDTDMLMEPDPFKNNEHPTAISFEPKLFKVRLEPRMHSDSDELHEKIFEGR